MPEIEVLGIELIDVEDFFKLLIRFALNTGILVLLIRYIYYPSTKRKDYFTTYLLIGMTVFFLCFLLENVKIKLGFALGLFAVFGIIRYRTDPIPIKEMTYLFLVIGISVINALSNKKISYAELFLANGVLVFLAYGVEKIWLLKHESRKTISYEKIELIHPEKRQELMDDLQARTGLIINRIEIGNIDFLRDTARIKIFYYEDDNAINTANQEYNQVPNND